MKLSSFYSVFFVSQQVLKRQNVFYVDVWVCVTLCVFFCVFAWDVSFMSVCMYMCGCVCVSLFSCLCSKSKEGA